MKNEMKPGASIPPDSWSPDKSSRLSVLVAMLALLVPTLGSGISVYLNCDQRITNLESQTIHLEKDEAEQKADVHERLTNIEQKLDRLLYEQAGVWSEPQRSIK